MEKARADDAHALARQGQWIDARTLLEDLDDDQLTPADHELLAVASGMTGLDEQEAAAWERAHTAWLEAGNVPAAARCAFWLGLTLVNRRLMAPAMGWFQRGQRLVDDADIDCAERHMFVIPRGLQLLSRDPGEALAIFDALVERLGSYDDREASALARLGRGQALIRVGDPIGGAAMLDEAMAAAVAGDVTPIAVGIIYCAVILECRRSFDVRRAREWTATLSQWCDRQQGLVPFRGQCLVHRSEVAQIDGDWDTAWNEAIAACDHLADVRGEPLLGMALHQRAELRRLRGEVDEAHEDYLAAADIGYRVDPGHQLLQLAMGDVDAADASIRRALAEAEGPVRRGRVLAGFAEIMLASGDVDAADEAANELGELAGQGESPVLEAAAALWHAAVLVARDKPERALPLLVTAEDIWRQIGAPWEVARVRLLRAEACARAGDTDTAEREQSAAGRILDDLGAVVDVARVRLPSRDLVAPGGLSPRELEVIRLLATGMTNKQIAADLVISEKTVARHLSNIFAKIDVSSRSAATAWAHRHDLA